MHSPSYSTADAMVQAVNIQLHVPVPGNQLHSTLLSSSMSITFFEYWPIASIIMPGSRFLPFFKGFYFSDHSGPGHAAPPKRKMPNLPLSEAFLHSAIHAPGTDLSQPPNQIIASAQYPSCIVSMQSQISSREGREYRIASVPCVMPSEITGVYYMCYLPPSNSISSAMIHQSSCILLLHGIMLL